MSDQDLLAELKELPEPPPPSNLVAAVMARTAEIDRERTAAASELARSQTAEAARRWRPQAAAVVALAGGLTAQVYALFQGERGFDPFSLRIGMESFWSIGLPDLNPPILILAAGVLLYLAGLFVPARHDG